MIYAAYLITRNEGLYSYAYTKVHVSIGMHCERGSGSFPLRASHEMRASQQRLCASGAMPFFLRLFRSFDLRAFAIYIYAGIARLLCVIYIFMNIFSERASCSYIIWGGICFSGFLQRSSRAEFFLPPWAWSHARERLSSIDAKQLGELNLWLAPIRPFDFRRSWYIGIYSSRSAKGDCYTTMYRNCLIYGLHLVCTLRYIVYCSAAFSCFCF